MPDLEPRVLQLPAVTPLVTPGAPYAFSAPAGWVRSRCNSYAPRTSIPSLTQGLRYLVAEGWGSGWRMMACPARISMNAPTAAPDVSKSVRIKTRARMMVRAHQPVVKDRRGTLLATPDPQMNIWKQPDPCNSFVKPCASSPPNLIVCNLP